MIIELNEKQSNAILPVFNELNTADKAKQVAQNNFNNVIQAILTGIENLPEGHSNISVTVTDGKMSLILESNEVKPSRAGKAAIKKAESAAKKPFKKAVKK